MLLLFYRDQEGRIVALQSEREYVLFSTLSTNVIIPMSYCHLQGIDKFYFIFRRLAESTETLKKENAIVKTELGEWREN